MSPLDEYQRKRDFAATPEPAGTPGAAHATPAGTGLSFVIQKHAATRLHYDFRLELDGVLLSWAVPKGPSLDTADKRLAMRVEDHPVEYGSFEGVIPAGEYGGGTVMLWDRGRWEPDHGDPREHLAQGHLKFYLYGERLRGRWMLVKTKGYGSKQAENSWLLFKERDDEARPKSAFDVLAEWTTSVATGRTMDEIAASGDVYRPPAQPAAPNPVRSGWPEGARVGEMEPSYPVELATLVDAVPDGERWLHEIKFDGYRALARLARGSATLLSRNGQDWTERFRDIASAVAALPAEQAVLDGEIVALAEDGTSDFQALQEHARRGVSAALHYQAFDLLYLDGHDLRHVPLEKRKELLAGLIPRHTDRIRYTDHIEGHGDVLFDRACGLALEGVVSKRRDAPYRAGRGRDWLKAKCLKRQEFVVVGYTDPSGSRSRFGALVLGVGGDRGLRYAGRVGTGFSEASLRTIGDQLAALVREEPPVSDPPSGAEAREIHWVEPRLVAEVSFAEWTRDGQLRHPSFLGLREDKPVTEVVVEKAEPAPAPPPETTEPATGSTRAAEPARVSGVTLSHPDRPMWPEIGITKLDLAHYYERVAEHLLPHAAERPLSLVRCPRGYAEDCFYQKHAENFGSEVGTVPIPDTDSGEVVPYARITGLPSLIGLVQLSVLEIHTWGARADDPEKPDRLVFDLDPDEAVGWEAVSATARLLRSELGRLGLESWVKTTGGKGLHVVVPVLRRHTWPEVHAFSRAFVESIVALEPALFTANMSKKQRQGRIFIDYLRNARGATAVAPYSTRARAGAPVSVPVTWSELEAFETAPVFTLLDVPERLASLPADPWVDLLGCRQSITSPMRRRLGID